MVEKASSMGMEDCSQGVMPAAGFAGAGFAVLCNAQQIHR